ncbi:MAG: hypothetical protein HC927_03070 [Deltaproteobacteria bacterium]|nr:hypothetical protein [Deltaproteobacteria bacterium]
MTPRSDRLLAVSLLAILIWAWPRPALAAGLSDETFYRIVLLFSAVGAGYVVTHLVVERLARRFTFAGGLEYVLLGVVLGPVLGRALGRLWWHRPEGTAQAMLARIDAYAAGGQG